MQAIFYIIILALFLLLLYFFHQTIIKYFSLASFLVFGTSKIGIYLYFLFFLPGVVLHELAHLFSASILGVPSGKLQLFPQKTEEGWTLGQVSSAETDTFRSSLIGLAPMIIGAASLVFIINFGLEIKSLAGFSNLLPNWKTLICLYLILTFTNTMFLSEEDKTSIWAFPGFLVLLFLFGRAMGLVGILTAIESFFYQATSILILTFSLTAILDLLFLAPLILTIEILAKIRG